MSGSPFHPPAVGTADNVRVSWPGRDIFSGLGFSSSRLRCFQKSRTASGSIWEKRAALSIICLAESDADPEPKEADWILFRSLFFERGGFGEPCTLALRRLQNGLDPQHLGCPGFRLGDLREYRDRAQVGTNAAR